MKKMLVIAGLMLLGAQAFAIGITQTAIAITVLPTATITASISGVNKEVLYNDGVEYVMQSEIDAAAAQPSLALREQLDLYAARNGVMQFDYLSLTNSLLEMELANEEK
ncbi:MAG: hypothetical protein KDD38_08245 [Bdellovibrionales bacterium]|nr:hypothetical protein [Bdellovibrionales bacterium]